MQAAEKKAAEEKRQRSSLEVSLASEKRARREAENALKVAAAAANPLGTMAANSFPSTPNAASSASSFTSPKYVSSPIPVFLIYLVCVSELLLLAELIPISYLSSTVSR